MSVEDGMHAERQYRQMMQAYQGDRAKVAAKLGLKPDKKGRYDFVDKRRGAVAKAAGKGLLNLLAGKAR